MIKNIVEAAKPKPEEEEKKEEPAATPTPPSNGTNFQELEDKIAAFKEKGNN